MNLTNQSKNDPGYNKDPSFELSRILFEKSSHALLLLDSHYHILDFNEEFRSLFFFYQDDLIGRSAQDVLRTPINQKILTGANQEFSDQSFKYDVILFDGLNLPREVRFRVITLPESKNTLIELTDITEENRLQRASNAIKEVQTAMQRSTTERELMDVVVKTMIDIGHYRFAFIGMIADDDAKSVVPQTCAGHEDGYLSHIRINLTDPALRNGPSGRAILNKVPTVCRDTEMDPLFAPWRTEALKRNYRSMISVPLLYLDRSIGVMNLYSKEINAFDTQEVKLVMQLSSALTYGIQMLRTQNELIKTSQDLDQSLEKMKRIITQIVGSLSQTIEFRDPFTDNHQKRVAQLAAAITKAMNLGQEKVHEITVAANLHDIGKVTIPNEILNKLTPVTPEEFEIVKTHSRKGHDIIKDVEFPWPIATIALQHHEKINGSGYPDGLKGEEILLSARIICVADVVEAMVSDRPYRKGLGMKAALDEITQNRGILYDENVVDACLALITENRFQFDDEI